MSISITFHGAAHTVTGSCYVVDTGEVKFMVDCGMFQGPGVEERNLAPFDFDASQIDFLLLTHTHIDHSGLVPKLVKAGFRGAIYCTLHTAQLLEILLFDSAKIQENNFQEGIPWKFSGIVQLLYTATDVEQTLRQVTTVNFQEEITPRAGITVKFIPAAHILGAASLEIDISGTKVVFSGDIGRRKHELIGGFDTEYTSEADYIIMESLYGGQHHPERRESVAELFEAINTTLERGGSVFIPCFAVQRCQELLHDIKRAKESGALAEDIPVLLDSPMAQRVTNLYRDALDHGHDSLFSFVGLRYVKTGKQSAKASRRNRQIVLAGSGMADGGRIMGHLAANLEDKRNCVVFVGYQAEGTMGRQIVDGASEVNIDHRIVKVKAEVKYLHGFSAHGDNNDYLTWINRFNTPRLKRILLVHAEPERAEACRDSLTEAGYNNVEIPDYKQTITLN